MGSWLYYLAAAVVVAWGVAHLFATRNVVRGFADISVDNRRVITMEWIVEGAALIFIGCLVAGVTLVDPASAASHTVYWLCFGMLNVMSLISLFTGFKVDFLAYRLCPVVFTGASILLLLGLLA
ncbi:MAG TPA: hypothetical protein VIM19_09285 [Actinomycetes bacterium]